jgi:hypothetical protein
VFRRHTRAFDRGGKEEGPPIAHLRVHPGELLARTGSLESSLTDGSLTLLSVEDRPKNLKSLFGMVDGSLLHQAFSDRRILRKCDVMERDYH